MVNATNKNLPMLGAHQRTAISSGNLSFLGKTSVTEKKMALNVELLESSFVWDYEQL